MALEWNCTVGEFSKVEQATRKALGQYNGRSKKIRIGRTNNPERRYYEHQRKQRNDGAKAWSRMIVLHETSNLREAKQAEALLIDWMEEKYGKAAIGNRRGGDTYYDDEMFVVYLLLDSLGDPKEEPDWLYSTGHTQAVISGLRKALAAYARHNPHIKVGRTNEPSRRWTEHQREREADGDSWERMVVIYVTSSSHYAREVEKGLIEHVRQKDYDVGGWNKRGGDQESLAKANYVYVLLE